MDGRRFAMWSAALLLLSGSVGCKWMHKSNDQGIQTPSGVVPVAAATPEKSSGFMGIGSSNKKFPGPPPEQSVVARAKPKKKGEPFKPETEIALADPELAEAMNPARTPVEQGQLLDKARQGYQKALALDPKNVTAMTKLAKVYELSGDKTRATQMYQDALKLAPKDHELQFKLAAMQARMKDWNASMESCEQAMRMDAGNRSYPKLLAYCQAQAGQWDNAFSTLLRVMPEADARYFLGNLLGDLDRFEEAKQQFELALVADPKHAASAELLAEMSAPPSAQPERITEQQNPVRNVGFNGQRAPIREGQR